MVDRDDLCTVIFYSGMKRSPSGIVGSIGICPIFQQNLFNHLSESREQEDMPVRSRSIRALTLN